MIGLPKFDFQTFRSAESKLIKNSFSKFWCNYPSLPIIATIQKENFAFPIFAIWPH